MSKRIIISSVFGLLIIVALVLVIFNKESEAPDNSQTNVSEPTAENEQAAPNEPSGTTDRYVDYSEAALASAEGQRVLFFHAPWCPQCQSIERTILEDEGSIPSDVTILKVDYDSNQELRQKYGVTIQTTFVKVDESGNLIDKYVAYDEPTIDAVKENFL